MKRKNISSREIILILSAIGISHKYTTSWDNPINIPSHGISHQNLVQISFQRDNIKTRFTYIIPWYKTTWDGISHGISHIFSRSIYNRREKKRNLKLTLLYQIFLILISVNVLKKRFSTFSL